MTDQADFIKAHTEVSSCAETPEIKLHLATEITPMWQATEGFLRQNGLAPPFWAFAWAGGRALARHILDHPEIVRGRVALDFASGSGLVAIAAALAGAKAVWTAEIDPFANQAIALNAALNGVELSRLDKDVLDQEESPWDVVLAGDVCYEKPMAERVFAFLERARRSGARVLIGDPGRAYLPKNRLTEIARLKIDCSLELEDRTSRDASIYQL